MKKTPYRDYAINAMELYYQLNKPHTIKDIQHSITVYELKSGIRLSAEEKDALTRDLIAVNNMVNELAGTDRRIIETVYITAKHKKGSITAAINKASLQCYTSTSTINRLLQSCRRSFARHRGLCLLEA